MSVARLVVAGVRLEGRKVSEVARDYDVSRQWIYMLLARYDEHGQAGLEPRSRRPHGNARATPPQVEQRIVELRKQLDDDGLDAGTDTVFHDHPDLTTSVADVLEELMRNGALVSFVDAAQAALL